jgi:hypothetical protein
MFAVYDLRRNFTFHPSGWFDGYTEDGTRMAGVYCGDGWDALSLNSIMGEAADYFGLTGWEANIYSACAITPNPYEEKTGEDKPYYDTAFLMFTST